MRKAAIYLNGILAGELTETSERKYRFRYDDDYFNDSGKPAISLTLPKNQQEYHSDYLFSSLVRGSDLAPCILTGFACFFSR